MALRIVTLSLLVLLLGGPLLADDCGCDKKKQDWGEMACSMTDGALQYLPSMVRYGADIYSTRLELIGEFYGKKAPDKKTKKILGRVKKNVSKLGDTFVDMVIDLRQRAGDMDFKKLWRMMRRRKAKKVRRARIMRRQRGPKFPHGPMMPPSIGVEAPMPPLPPAPPRPPAARGFMWHAHFQHLAKELRLSNSQRIEAKMLIVRYAPSMVRHGATAASEGMEIGRLMMKKKIDEELCKEHVETIAKSVSTIVSEFVHMAFEVKDLLNKKQEEHLLANIPLRLILLR